MKYTMYDAARYALDTVIQSIGINKPENYDQIISFMVNDMKETADPDNFTSEDAAIAFRRFLESKSN
jgi:hypothetical protein